LGRGRRGFNVREKGISVFGKRVLLRISSGKGTAPLLKVIPSILLHRTH